MTGAKVLYGALFVVLVPALLVLWAAAAQPNISLPVNGSRVLGQAIAASGLVLMCAAMGDLWRLGGGLPMNAFPPPKLVVGGTFRWIPHPIYTGFVALCFGVAMAAGSAAGLWLVSPSVALGCAALVLGYERLDLRQRFRDTLHLLPPDEETPPTNAERLGFLIVVVAPWIALYEFTVRMSITGTAFGFAFEDHWPIYAWTTLIYESCYLAVALAPWGARTRRDLRQLMISAWVAMVVVYPIYWIVPSTVVQRHMGLTSWVARLLEFERTADPPTAALPSFHVLWAIFVGRLFRPRWLGAVYAGAVAVSCVTTGMHYVADVIAALAIAPVLLQPQAVWWRMLRLTERIANSWKEWRIGPVRVINYALYAFLAAFVQVALVAAALGPGREWKVLVTAAAGLVGAAVWAQWIEGSSLLRRPFGFYGGLIAVGLACLCFPERWTLLAAHCLAAPWMQAIGRFRCLVNGCCHGAPAPEGAGIRVTDPRSRVTRLAKLAGVAIYPTQLYSILSNSLLGLMLLRLGISGCALSLICGVYAIGNGAARFVEEAYRGEPQTLLAGGLHLYQWLAMGCMVTGAVLSALPAPGAPALVLTGRRILLALAFGVVSGAAMGVDFPEVNRPLARLT